MAQSFHIPTDGVAPIADGCQKGVEVMLHERLPGRAVAKAHEQTLSGLKLAIAVGDPFLHEAGTGEPGLARSPRRGSQCRMQPIHRLAPKQEWLTRNKPLKIGAAQPPDGPSGPYRKSGRLDMRTLSGDQRLVHAAGLGPSRKKQAVAAAFKGRQANLRELLDNRFTASQQGCGSNFASLAAMAESHIVDDLGKAVDVISSHQHIVDAGHRRIWHRQFLSVSP
ncbi:hypothetical protein [Sphingopyxis sp. EG6]|uniref:hypothetical protein n=1 Tax=Sphingopyxis sp. EG6 TaxID=1874061 RepID=UPI001558CDF0|nr:hypothetical protein [Sphingopyxis sp. EG6]